LDGDDRRQEWQELYDIMGPALAQCRTRELENSMFMLVLIPLVFGGAFYAGNEDFFDTASRQVNDGYDWHYIGYKRADMKVPSLPLQVDGYEPYVIWKLKKVK
jgi:hypothetical protein